MKILRLALIILIVVSFAGFACAEVKQNFTPVNKTTGTKPSTVAKEYGVGMKAERGVKNLLFGWTEIPKSIIQVTRDSKNPFWGITGGTFKGIGKAFPRTVSGAADIVSAPMGDYNKTPIKPDEWQTQVK
jgi:putative exosortase-associated protein (TIGR04073 family)